MKSKEELLQILEKYNIQHIDTSIPEDKLLIALGVFKKEKKEANKNENIKLLSSSLTGAMNKFKDLYNLVSKFSCIGIVAKTGLIGSEITDQEFISNIVNMFDFSEFNDASTIEDLYKNPEKKFIFNTLWKRLLVDQEDFTSVRNELVTQLNNLIERDKIDTTNKNKTWTNFTIQLKDSLCTLVSIKTYIPGVVCDYFYGGVKTVEGMYIFNETDKPGVKSYTASDGSILGITIVVGPDVKSYKGLPFYATHVWEQTKKDLFNHAVTFGRDTRTEELVTNKKFFIDKGFSEKTLIIPAGSGSGKGVLGLVILANALRFDMPVIYLDCKPDMARTLFELSNPLESLTIDGLSELGCKAKAIKRNIGDVPYLEYAKHTFPQEFYQFVGDEMCESLANAIAYTKVIQLITNFIDKTSENETSYRPLFVIDEIQNYSEKLNFLCFEGKMKDGSVLGGKIGEKIQGNSSVPSSVKRYYLQLQQWFENVWARFEGTYSATYRKANFSLMVIFQSGALLRSAVPFIYRAIAGLKSATTIYGKDSFGNSSAFNSQGAIAALLEQEEKKGRQDNAASEWIGVGKFIYKEGSKVIPLQSCLIVNDGISADGKLIERDPKTNKMGNLYNTFHSADIGVQNLVIKELFGEVIPREQWFTTPIPEDGQVLDFAQYCRKVLNYKTDGTHTIAEKMNDGFKKLEKFLIYNGESKTFFERLYDFAPKSMGIEDGEPEFAKEIANILRSSAEFKPLIESKNPAIKIPVDEQGHPISNFYKINLPSQYSGDEGFETYLSRNDYKKPYLEKYNKQLLGQSIKSDAKDHIPLFKELVEWLSNNAPNLEKAWKDDEKAITDIKAQQLKDEYITKNLQEKIDNYVKENGSEPDDDWKDKQSKELAESYKPVEEKLDEIQSETKSNDVKDDSPFIQKLRQEASKTIYDDIAKGNHIRFDYDYYELSDFAKEQQVGDRLIAYEDQLKNHNGNPNKLGIHVEVLKAILNALKQQKPQQTKNDQNDKETEIDNTQQTSNNKENKEIITKYTERPVLKKDLFTIGKTENGEYVIDNSMELNGVMLTKDELIPAFKKEKDLEKFEQGWNKDQANGSITNENKLRKLFMIQLTKKMESKGIKSNNVNSLAFELDRIIVNNIPFGDGAYSSLKPARTIKDLYMWNSKWFTGYKNLMAISIPTHFLQSMCMDLYLIDFENPDYEQLLVCYLFDHFKALKQVQFIQGSNIQVVTKENFLQFQFNKDRAERHKKELELQQLKNEFDETVDNPEQLKEKNAKKNGIGPKEDKRKATFVETAGKVLGIISIPFWGVINVGWGLAKLLLGSAVYGPGRGAFGISPRGFMGSFRRTLGMGSYGRSFGLFRQKNYGYGSSMYNRSYGLGRNTRTTRRYN